ncbi:MAG: M23 family metallopeptidase [Lachnospiraceae bacterium]|nr:M23 family metallopeptidase [Lachnospiraceae bacterium]
MKYITHFHKRIKIHALKVLLGAWFVAAFFLPCIEFYESTGDNRFTVYLYGEKVGYVANTDMIEDCIRQARRELASESEGLYIVEEPEIIIEGEETFWSKCDDKKTVTENIKAVMAEHEKETLIRAYTVKVNSQTVNLRTAEEVSELLSRTIATYDTEGQYELAMNLNPDRELNVLTANVTRSGSERQSWDTEAGVSATLTHEVDPEKVTEYMDFDDFELGIKEIAFSEEVEVVEAYILEEELSTLDEAINLLTEEQEVQQIYEVKSGDTLSEISITVGIPMETIVEMNGHILDNVNSTLNIGDELIITVPEPELSVIWTNREHYKEIYEAEIIYIPNDEWYTTQMVTLQEPSAGFREVVADVTYENDDEIARNVVKEEVIMEAVPKIVERGTIVPPTYVKPISGGRLSSRFGRRSAPTAGASTYHKGVDWATPVGTPVYASSGGTVAKAGWGSGYGYVVYINHPDGRQTRYAHLSKVLVSPGQTVSQGDKIALSGNTGVSSGPHVHFEILIGGKQVNLLDYL